MWHRTELANYSETELAFVIESEGEDVVVVALDYCVRPSALHHGDALALQKEIGLEACFQFALSVLAVPALAVLVAAKANEQIHL